MENCNIPNAAIEKALKSFRYHSPSPTNTNKMKELRFHFGHLVAAAMVLVPESRERSIMITKLEEAQMFAMKSLAINDPLAVEEPFFIPESIASE